MGRWYVSLRVDFDIREYRKSLRLVTGATADAML